MLKIIGWVVLVAAAIALVPGIVILALLAFAVARAARMGWSR